MKYIILFLIFLAQATFAQPGTMSEEEVAIEKVFLEGKGQMIQGHLEKAAAIFEQVLEKDRTNAAAAYELSRIFDLQEENDKAIKFAQKAADWEETNFWYHILLADLYQKTNNDDKAAGVYEKLTDLFPSNDDYYFKWAYYLVRTGEPQKAIKVYETLEDKMGVNEEITRRKHSLFLGLGDYKKAEKELLELVNTYPNNVSFLHFLAGFYEQIGQGDKARSTFEKILSINPKDAQASIALTQTNKRGGDEGQHLTNLEKVFRNPNIHIDVKITEIFPFVTKVADTGDKNLAAAVLELTSILEEIHPSQAKSFAVSGDLLYYSEQNEAALDRYKKTLELDENVYAVWEQMLFIYAELGDHDNLVKESENALDLFPNQGTIYYLNGLGYSGQEEHKNSISSLQQALMMSGKNPRLKFQIHTLLGGEYAELKQAQRSDENFEEALKLNPNDPLVLNNFAFYLSERGVELEKAKDMAGLCNELLPNRASFEDTYGWILYKMKDYKGAKKWLGQAIGNGGGGNSMILEHYGDVLFQLNEVENAILNWQKALEKGSTSDVLEKKIAEKKLFE